METSSQCSDPVTQVAKQLALFRETDEGQDLHVDCTHSIGTSQVASLSEHKPLEETIPKCSHSSAKKNANRATAKELYRLVTVQQRERCALCGVGITPNTAEVDHKIPRERGGSDCIDNLQWLCIPCNRAKWSLPQDEFVALCERIAIRKSGEPLPPVNGS